MKILITGATGGLGRNCIDLLKDKHEIIATGRNTEIGFAITQMGVKFIPADLCGDITQLVLIMSDVDAVIHCAALASPTGLWEDFYSANFTATKNLIKLAKQNKVKRFIHISTPSVYHTGTSRTDIKESDLLPKAKTFYAKSKLMAEEMVLKEMNDSFQVTILRPRALIGKYDQVVLPRITELLSKKYFPFFNQGNALIDVTCISNVVIAIECALNLPQIYNGRIYNITNGQPLQIKQLINLLSDKSQLAYSKIHFPVFPLKCLAHILEFLYIKGILNNAPKLSSYGLDLLSLDQTLNIDLAINELKYKPKETIDEALTSYLNWRKNEAV